ncbi:peptidoglycan recognition protein family protein [Pararhizobium gei]|uniref:peptidoglycan recognition protein family protein n=1 Tax=Pararhizobium gei TaxID=1395951 RepID=UPI0023DAF7C2|nr:peptidoglycan-binding domain-containing protein [Rhizobium gei]
MSYRFRKPTRPVTRVFLHCSASDNPAHDNAATMDQWHKERGWAGIGYNLFIRKSGLLEIGRSLEVTPAAQAGHNTGTIAICLHGLKAENFTQAQFATLKSLCDQINVAYGGKVTFHGHCEVARKACPVFDYKRILSLDSGGHFPLVHLTTPSIETPTIGGIEHLEEPDMRGPSVLQFGDRGSAVEDLQKKLAALGYFPGRIDGDFGEKTRAAVLAFQADNHLVTDGKYGSGSREAMKKAKPAPVSAKRSAATLATLASEGSTIAKASLNTQVAGGIAAVGGILVTLNEASGILTKLTDSMGSIGDILDGLSQWQGAGIAALGIYVVLRSLAAGRNHVADYRSGKTA